MEAARSCMFNILDWYVLGVLVFISFVGTSALLILIGVEVFRASVGSYDSLLLIEGVAWLSLFTLVGAV